MQSSAKATGLSEMLRQRFRHRPQTLLQIAPFGTAEMREKDHLPALVGDLVDRRQDALDAGRIGDPAVLHRNVEIDANEDALSLDVGLVERAESGHRAAPSDQLRHGDGGIRHAVREAPFVIVPGQHADEGAVHHLGLVHVEGGRMPDRG